MQKTVAEEPILDSQYEHYAQVPAKHNIEGQHRHRRSMFVGVHPSPANEGERKRRRRRGSSLAEKADKMDKEDTEDEEEEQKTFTDPSQHVKFLLGAEPFQGEAAGGRQLFCEMDELVLDGNNIDTVEWKETARWIKFEEDVEEGGERWSKPYVATLSLYSLFEVRNCMATGVIMLDVEAVTMDQVADLTLNKLIGEGKLPHDMRDRCRDVLLRKHSHLHDRRHKTKDKPTLPIIRSIADMGRKNSSKDMYDKATLFRKLTERRHSEFPGSQAKPSPLIPKSSSFGNMVRLHPSESEADDLQPSASTAKFDQHFMKKIPPGAETSNILVGETDFLHTNIVALVRLKEAVVLGDLTEVPVPTRFLYIQLGPAGQASKNHEIGRSVATLMSDEVFRDVAYKARYREDLMAGIDEFLKNCTVLPPGEWDPSIRLEPPKSVPSQEARKTFPPGQQPMLGSPNGMSLASPFGDFSQVPGSPLEGPSKPFGEEEDEEHAPTLVRTGRLFGGLMEDIRRKKAFYLSDLKDALHIQCFASFFFLYFACLTPIITFGGLLAMATDGYLGTIESILAGAIVGVTYALCSGQPLTILGSTGPVLVFEQIVYTMCLGLGWNYLSFRLWIGLWCSLFLFLIVAFDMSYLVKYITRFTEESFAFLIALIFIMQAFKKLIHILDYYPLNTYWTPQFELDRNCSCMPPERNYTAPQAIMKAIQKAKLEKLDLSIEYGWSDAVNSTVPVDVVWENITSKYFTWKNHDYIKLCKDLKGSWVGTGCTDVAVPDVFFFSVLLFLGTFVISYGLKMMRTSHFFPNRVRSLIGDFAVMIAITVMTLIDALMGFHTPKLNVPRKFEPTLGYGTRGWIVPILGGNPWYTILIAIAPALLAVILIFMDQQITAVIVNRKENKLKKGAGYHLDLLNVAVLIAINSVLGIPWFVAATVLSINHVISLKKESENTAPGERPVFLGCREQRVTGVIIFLTIGLSVFLTPILSRIPMAVLYGVFLFMGVASLRGVQFMQRIMLFAIPPKYQPDYIYLRHVPLRRVHLFTLIQVICLVILYTIKSIQRISICFPLMVLAMCFIRKALEYVFTQHELKWLDDIMPEHKKREEEDLEMEEEEEEEEEEEMKKAGLKGGVLEVPLAGGKVVSVPVEKVTFHPAPGAINFTEEMMKTALWRQLAGSTTPEQKRRRKSKGRKASSPARPDLECGLQMKPIEPSRRTSLPPSLEVVEETATRQRNVTLPPEKEPLLNDTTTGPRIEVHKPQSDRGSTEKV